MMSTSTNKKVNPATRVNEFPGEFKAMSESSLMCIYCNHEVDWKKKSILNDHLKSSKHIECKLGAIGAKKPITIEEILQTRQKKGSYL